MVDSRAAVTTTAVMADLVETVIQPKVDETAAVADVRTTTIRSAVQAAAVVAETAADVRAIISPGVNAGRNVVRIVANRMAMTTQVRILETSVLLMNEG